jgi:hypothetical protein
MCFLFRFISIDAQTYTMTNDNTIYGCTGTLLDPGGSGNYSPNVNITQVLCPSNGSCLELVFSMVDMETNVDQLTIYSGIDTTGYLIATISGSAFNDTIRSTSFEDGCLALNFKSNLFIQQSGFAAEVSCAPCQLNPELITLGEVDGAIITCNTTIVQPNTSVIESRGNIITQTFCSGNDSCLKYAMRNSSLNTALEFVRVYAGTDVNGYLLSTFSGFTSETINYLNYRMSENPCITIEYERMDQSFQGHFEMILECTSCSDLINSIPNTCRSQVPICELSEEVEFPLHTSNKRAYMSSIGCMGSSPNPSWYYIHPSSNSPIDIQLNASSDIDFICWGPFTETQYDQGVCELIMNPEWANNAENIIDCSYSSSSSENLLIPEVLPNSYYVVLVTRFSFEQEQDTMTVTFNESVSGLACTPFCNGVLNIEVSECDSLTNTYSLQGTLALDNPEIDGIILLNSSYGFTTELYAPFDSLISFNFTNLAANGELNTLSITHNDGYSCGTYFTYSSPSTCSECPVNIEEIGNVCEGDSLTIYSDGINLNQFNWTGPNGFESNQQNIHFDNFTSEMEGVYDLIASNSVDGCSSRNSVFIYTQSLPPLPLITTNAPFCGSDTLVLNAEFIEGYQTRWRGPNNYYHEGNNTIIIGADEMVSGYYSYLLTNGFCFKRVDSIEVIIHPIPETPVLALTSLNDSIIVSPSFSEYTWKINGEYTPEFNSQIIPITTTGYYQVFCLDEFGCSAMSEAAFFVGFEGEVEQHSIQLFPNPAQHLLHYKNANKGNWEIYDVSGRQIEFGLINSESGSISISALSSGLYYFKLESKEGQIVIPFTTQK